MQLHSPHTEGMALPIAQTSNTTQSLHLWDMSVMDRKHALLCGDGDVVVGFRRTNVTQKLSTGKDIFLIKSTF